MLEYPFPVDEDISLLEKMDLTLEEDGWFCILSLEGNCALLFCLCIFSISLSWKTKLFGVPSCTPAPTSGTRRQE